MRSKIFMLTLMSFICLIPALAKAADQDPLLTKFIEGNFAYKDGRYQEAVEIYEGIVKNGHESGALYYNLANSYIKLNLLGKAILNYERANKLIPRDNDLKASYKFTASRLNSQNRYQSNSFWRKLIDSHIHFYTLDEMAIVLFLVAGLAGLINLLALYFRWDRGNTIIFMAILGFIFSLYLTGFILKVNVNSNLAVTVVDSAVRFEPLDDATVYFDLQEGSKVKIIQKEGPWLKVKRFDGKSGWVQAQKIGVI